MSISAYMYVCAPCRSEEAVCPSRTGVTDSTDSCELP